MIANLDKKENLSGQSLDSLAENLEEEKASEPDITVATNKKELKQASLEGVDLAYYKPKGGLFVDGSGDLKGFSNKNQGGIIADLPNSTPLTETNILVGE